METSVVFRNKFRIIWVEITCYFASVQIVLLNFDTIHKAARNLNQPISITFCWVSIQHRLRCIATFQISLLHYFWHTSEYATIFRNCSDSIEFATLVTSMGHKNEMIISIAQNMLAQPKPLHIHINIHINSWHQRSKPQSTSIPFTYHVWEKLR